MLKDEKNVVLEYRYYNLPNSFPIIGLLQNNFTFKPDTTLDITLLHFHNCIEISYCFAGDKIAFVEEKTLNFSTGDICIIPPYAMHITKNRKLELDLKSDQCEYLYFDPEHMLQCFYPNGLPTEMKWYHYSNFNNVINSEKYPQIANSVLYILNELRYTNEGYEYAVRSMLLSLMIELTRIIPKPTELDVSLNDRIRIISPALNYISCRYSQPIDVNDLSKLCHMSLTHFRRYFKQLMNCSPSKYIHHVRLQKACELLDSTEQSILDISLTVGFKSVSSFNRHFINAMHKTPSQWRNERCIVKKKNLKYSTFDFNQQIRNQ
jgi:AraC-like DNA-binding protein